MAISMKHHYDELQRLVAAEFERGREVERAKIVAWLRHSADGIVGNTLSGEYVVDWCMMAADAIDIAAHDIEAKEHLK